MGTRSLTHIYSAISDKTPFVTIYRHNDGNPEAHGEQIKEILGPRKLVTGYSSEPFGECNGISCAAALLIGELKGGQCGNIYVYQAGHEVFGSVYTYRIYPDGESFRMVIDGIYDGPIREFDAEKLSETA